MKNSKHIFLLVLVVLSVLPASAQTTIAMDGEISVTGCSFRVVAHNGAHGGPGSAFYNANRDDILTITSDDPANPSVVVQVDMGAFDVSFSDTLFFYDGTVDSALLGWVNNANTHLEGLYRFQTTVYNTSRTLTIRFKSGSHGRGRGYTLNVGRSRVCQRIKPIIDFEHTTPPIHLDTALNDGYYYIDLCPGANEAHIVIDGSYPDNDFGYHQSDGTSVFHWNFGEGELEDGAGLSTIDHVFPVGSGYDVSITMEDSAGCYASTAAFFRVRTSTNPIRSISEMPDVCAGDTIAIDVGYEASSFVMVDSIGNTHIASLSVNDTVFLPDGISCPPYGFSYRSPVTFACFPPGATITSADDILYVRLNIEHSWIGDIKIELECPSQQRSIILEDYQNYFYDGVVNAHFGMCNEVSDVLICDTAGNPQGIGWNYIWSDNTTEGYVYSASPNGFVYENANIQIIPNPLYPPSYIGTIVDSSNVAAMTQIYHPYQSFGTLAGCPLNGQWAIVVTDTWPLDNGYVFGWEMALRRSLMPGEWEYNVAIDTVLWEGHNVVPTDDGGCRIITDTASDSTSTYRFTIVDAFGCEYSGTMPLNVVQHPVPDLGEDVSICVGETAVLSSGVDYPGPEGQIAYNWSNGASSESITVADTGRYELQITVFNADHTLECKASDSVRVDYSPHPVASFEADPTDGCSPLETVITPHITYTDGDYPEITATMIFSWVVTDADQAVVATSDDRIPHFVLDEVGSYTVQLAVMTAQGCTDTAIYNDYLTMHIQPVAAFIANPERVHLREGGEIHFTNTTP